MDENKRKHLEFIQAIIERMARNSFFLKGWSLTLVTGIFAFIYKEESESLFFLIAIFPIVIFWILDGYFLSQERLFRALYGKVSKAKEEDIDYSMNIMPFTKGDIKKNKKTGWIKSMFSVTLNLFYIPMILTSLFIAFCISF